VLADIIGVKRVVLTAEGTTDLGDLYSSAVALNNLLQVVGSGGIWEAGEIRSIDGVEGRDINDAGQVAGFKGGAAVVWDDGVVTEIGLPEAFSSQAYGINEAGQAVGWAEVPPRNIRPLFWDGNTSTDLETLAGQDGIANAINDLVQIVGESKAANGEWHACLWEDGAIADLNDLLTEPFPYTLVDAVDINNLGQIACRAVDSRGIDYAVLLNPVPEPGTPLLLALGGAAGALRRRRRG
jgi:probable HAF family extracellular repeat protein